MSGRFSCIGLTIVRGSRYISFSVFSDEGDEGIDIGISEGSVWAMSANVAMQIEKTLYLVCTRYELKGLTFGTSNDYLVLSCLFIGIWSREEGDDLSPINPPKAIFQKPVLLPFVMKAV